MEGAGEWADRIQLLDEPRFITICLLKLLLDLKEGKAVLKARVKG